MADCVTGAAMRRLQRRLRSWWRHEQQSIATALAAAQHHSAQKSAGPVSHNVLRNQNTGREGTECYAMSEHSDVVGGGRPPLLMEVQCTVVPTVETFVPSPCLDLPVPQVVESIDQILQRTVEADFRQVHLRARDPGGQDPSLLKTEFRCVLSFVIRRWSNSWWKYLDFLSRKWLVLLASARLVLMVTIHPRAVFDSGMRNDGVVGVVSCGAALGSGTRKDDLLVTIILEHFSPVAGATLVLLVTFFLKLLHRQWLVQGS